MSSRKPCGCGFQERTDDLFRVFSLATNGYGLASDENRPRGNWGTSSSVKIAPDIGRFRAVAVDICLALASLAADVPLLRLQQEPMGGIRLHG